MTGQYEEFDAGYVGPVDFTTELIRPVHRVRRRRTRTELGDMWLCIAALSLLWMVPALFLSAVYDFLLHLGHRDASDLLAGGSAAGDGLALYAVLFWFSPVALALALGLRRTVRSVLKV